jgi:hypothetical protein
MSAFTYVYELRSGDAIVATGRLATEQPFALGGETEIAGHAGVVRSIEPVIGGREWRVVVQLSAGAGNT